MIYICFYFVKASTLFFFQPSAIPSRVVDEVPSSTASTILKEGLLAKAIYPWKARQETDLTFDKDDVILVKEQQEMKWFGELNGKVLFILLLNLKI